MVAHLFGTWIFDGKNLVYLVIMKSIYEDWIKEKYGDSK